MHWICVYVVLKCLQCVAFDDISPESPVHFLVIPRKPIVSLLHVGEEDQTVRAVKTYVVNGL